MKILPAIDIINGECVRLTEGDYDQKKVYNSDPLKVAKNFETHGFEYLHIVDLDGAKSGNPENVDIIRTITKETNLKIQLGGGIRNMETVEAYFQAGVWRIILGSSAVKDPDFFQACVARFEKEKIVLGLDLKDEKVAISGWQEIMDITAEEFLTQTSNLHTVLVTDISKDGKLQGPNFQLYKKLMIRFPELIFIASGGISCLEDIQKLKAAGVPEVIVGKAIYEGRIQISDLQTAILKN